MAVQRAAEYDVRLFRGVVPCVVQRGRHAWWHNLVAFTGQEEDGCNGSKIHHDVQVVPKWIEQDLLNVRLIAW